jgi:ribosomal protein L37AE/L43A
VPPPRAEFIRVQCEEDLYRPRRDALEPDERRAWHDLTMRRDTLLTAHEHEWRRAGKCVACGGEGGFNRKGAMWWDDCPACHGTGDAGGLLRRLRPYHPDYGHAGPEQWAHPVRWRRGLPDAVECTLAEVLERDTCPMCRGSEQVPDQFGTGVYRCPECDDGSYSGEWRPTSWARAVATHHPSVTRFVLTDREPRSFGAGEWQWLRGGLRDQFGAWELPEPVFDGLSRDPDRAVYAFQQPRRSYPTREAALDEMVVAAMKVVRG